MPSIYDTYFQITNESVQKYGPTTILFYQVGAFFEMYGVQAVNSKTITRSRIHHFTQLSQLNVSAKKDELTGGSSIMMAGFRDYSLDKYIKIATQNGYTAVVYNQNATNPRAITRELYGVFSPGTFISFDTDSSPELSNNTICIWMTTHTTMFSKNKQLVCGITSAHIFTGESCIFEYDTPFIMNPTTFDELERYISVVSPSEAIIISFLSETETNQAVQYLGLKTRNIHILDTTNTSIELLLEKCQKETYISHMLSTFFGDESYSICKEFQMYPTGTYALCYLLHFLQERNPDLVKKIKIPQFLNSNNRVVLANHTLKQLNIIDDSSTDCKQAGTLSSVASFLNQCCTPMGRRTFHTQITNPTTDQVWLNTEYNNISTFLDTPSELFAEIRRQLRTMRDLEKICRQIMVRKVYPNTIFQMYETLSVVRVLVGSITNSPIPSEHIPDAVSRILELFDSTLYINRCQGIDTVSSFQETIFKQGIFKSIDKVSAEYQTNKYIFDKLHKTLNNMMKQQPTDETVYVKIHETEKSGVSLQITKKRSETLKKCLKGTLEITPEFVVQAKNIRFVKASATTEEIEFPQLTALLSQMFILKEQLSIEIAKGFADFLTVFETNKVLYDDIDNVIQWTIKLDVLQSKTYVAKKYNYCKPSIAPNSDRSFFDAKSMRHVLIEHIQQNEVYVTNDLDLSSPTSKHDGILVFGTNAVGKTSLIRAVGICIIMSQSGCYVPCETFVYSPYKSIFSRILGNDNLFKGLSTFAVEMSELRVILKSADQHGLVLADELCSGTEMESALSLFSAGLVQLCNKRTTFLFATHFHEITGYTEISALTRLGLKHMTVQYNPSTGVLIYNRILNDGQGSRMYGLEVCRSLYMDPVFLEQAYAFRSKYFPEQRGDLEFNTTSYNSSKIRGKCEICQKGIASETHHLTPQHMADKNGIIHHYNKNHPGNLVSICETCHLEMHKYNTIMVKQKSTNGYVLSEK